MADKLKVPCRKVPREAMGYWKNNVIVSTGKDGYNYDSEVIALDAAMKCYNSTKFLH